MVKKENKELIYSISSLIALIIILFFLFKLIPMPANQPYQEGSYRSQCPYKVEGNINSSFVIKYIDSPYCIWCWIEEGVLKKAIAKKGNSFRLERYDIRYCSDIVRKYGFSGTPSFVFSLDNGKKEYTHFGYIPEDRFNQVICDATGDC